MGGVGRVNKESEQMLPQMRRIHNLVEGLPVDLLELVWNPNHVLLPQLPSLQARPYPKHRVGGEPKPLLRIELFRGLVQADAPGLEQIPKVVARVQAVSHVHVGALLNES